MIVTTPAIVIKSFDFRETSKIVTFFTQNQGKVSGILKGLRNNPKKFGSNVDRFTVNQLVYYRYSRTDLHLVGQCDMVEHFFDVRQDYKKQVAAHYCLELIDKIMPTEHANSEIYDLMIDFLRSLDQGIEIDRLIHLFQIKILEMSGFRPHLDSCVSCGTKISTGKIRFSPKSGGLICPNCPTTDYQISIISPGTINTMIALEKVTWSQALRIGLTQVTRKELKYLLNNFLVYHLEKKINSAVYL